MFVLVVTTLVIGLLGIYAQVLALQAAQFASAQNGLAIMMMTWHAAAVSMGASVVDTVPPGLTYPCSLTYSDPFPIAVLPLCVAPTGSGSTTGTVTGAATAYNPNFIFNTKLTVPAAEPVHLPANYNTATYQFYSVLYQDTSSVPPQPYVVTFVQPPTISAANPAPGYLSLPPTGTMTSHTMSDLIHQFQVSGLQPYSYGTVQGGWLVTSGFKFLMPPNPVVPGTSLVSDGSMAIISSPVGY